MSEWISLNPDDTTFGPDPHMPVWLTDGNLTILAVRLLSTKTHAISSQYVATAGFEMLANPTHFAYAAPPLPKLLET